jgi:hypothetical protein
VRVTRRRSGADTASFPKQKKRGSAHGSDREKRDVVFNEIGLHHQGEPEEHRFPSVHSLPVNESDEPDRTEDQSTNKIRAAEDRHDVFRANFAPVLAM